MHGWMVGWLSFDHTYPKSTFEEVKKAEGGAGWARLAEIMDLSKDEWVAQLESRGGGGGEDEGGEEVEQEDEEDGEGGEAEDALEDEDV